MEVFESSILDQVCMSSLFPNIPNLPQGIFPHREGFLWRVWAPEAKQVTLVLWPEGLAKQSVELSMQPTEHGFFEVTHPQAPSGLRYAYRLDTGDPRPDPVTRWQPDGVHRPSAVFWSEEFSWADANWTGVGLEDLVLYELHVGTFTVEGTFEAVVARLKELLDLGITAIELMPVGQFPGGRNWGYDGVHPFAAQNTYGGPQGLQNLVNEAHRLGMAVFLDVIYNHLGPEGNYLSLFGPYFTDRYQTPWGQALNYDGPQSDPVRQMMVDNACMWVRDFHIDGLRLDAVHAIYDLEAEHILAEIQANVQAVAQRQNRQVHVIAESNQNDTRLIDRPEHHAYGLDGIWSDDFHHAVHTIVTGETEGYYRDFGKKGHLIKAFRDVFVYDGQYSIHRQRRHGSKVANRDRKQFVVSVQNHDQVGNRAVGDRFGPLISTEAQRLAGALLLLCPCTPMLFMGEEYGERNPFPFFCSFEDSQLNTLVREGRREEFAAHAFEWDIEPPDPPAESTFLSAKLSWSWPEGSLQGGIRQMYRDLLRARRHWKVLHEQATAITSLDDQEDSPFMILAFGDPQKFLMLANLSATAHSLPTIAVDAESRLFSTWDVKYSLLESAPTEETLHPWELVVYGSAEYALKG